LSSWAGWPGRSGSRHLNRAAIGVGAFVIACAIAVAVAGLALGNHGSPTPEVLPPAPGPPVGRLCTQPLTTMPNGSVTPLFCSNGDVNRLAWRYFADKNLTVMGLGIFAADTDVATAIRQDLSGHATEAVECSAYQLASVYYGWGFGVDPTSGALAGGCPVPRH